MTDTTVLLSGGIDSASAVHFFQAQSRSVRGLFVDFGQSSAPMERRAIAALRNTLGISVDEIRASGAARYGAGELIGRNAFLIFSAILLGGCTRGVLAIGVHDGTPYFDCSSDFISKIDRLVRECTDGRVTISAPFAQWSKDDVYSYFLSTRIPLELTYSCEAGSEFPCGVCLSCLDRKKLQCLPNEER